MRVLILEDNENDTLLLLRALRRGDLEIDPTVVSTEEAYLEALEDPPRLIIADYSLVNFDALRALRRVNERGLDIPFIVVTGTVREEVVVECMRLGATDYLLKDRLTRLGDAVRRALDAYELKAENRAAELQLQEARLKAQRDYDALLGRLNDLAQRIGFAPRARNVYRALFDFCSLSTPADSIIISRFDIDEELRTCVYSAGMVAGEFEEDDVSRLPRMPLNDGPQGRAIRSGNPVVVPDYQKEVAERNLKPLTMGSDAAENPVRSAAAIPLKIQGRIIGVFEVQTTGEAQFNDAHVVSLTMAANQAAIAMENAELIGRERELRAVAENSEQRYRTLVEQASDGIVVFDRGGTVLQTNSMMRELMGVGTGGAREGDVRAWLVDQDSSPWNVPFGRLDTGHTVLAERLLRRTGGADLPVETNTKKLTDGLYQTIVRDISERKRAAQALIEEKVFSETLINSLPGIFYLFDEKLQLVRWNKNLNVVSGYADEEIARMSPLDFFRPEDRAYLMERTQDTLTSGSASAAAGLLTKSGESVPYVFSAVQLVREGRSYVMGTGLDISQQQRAEQRVTELNLELEKRLARMSALHEIDMAITGSTDLRRTLDVILEMVMRELGVQASSVWVYEKDADALTRVCGKGIAATSRAEPRTRLGYGPVGRCGMERQRLRLRGAELATTQAVHGVLGEFSDYVAVPLTSKGQLQGVLEVFCRESRDLDDDWFAFLEALALQTAIAIDNVTLFQRLERSAIDLTLAYDATIEGWARALDMRDHETEGHSRRVTELTVGLARQMGVDEAELAHVRRGALLHDIGKLGVPDSILMKAGALDDKERALMQRHAQLGYELLAPIDFLKPAIDIPYCHHEAWDGSGYPRGLAGEDIPLPARIFAVADVYDALTSDRPYRSAWPVERTLTYLRERSGSQFDPAAVEAFLELYGAEARAAGGLFDRHRQGDDGPG